MVMAEKGTFLKITLVHYTENIIVILIDCKNAKVQTC